MNGTVLIVSTVVRRARILEKPLTEAGFKVVVATSGRDGIALCRRGSVDIVLLEALQPDLDGCAFCRLLKGEPALRHLPVALITEECEPRQRFQALLAGANECLSFPMAEMPFLMRLRSLVVLKGLTDAFRRAATIAGIAEPTVPTARTRVLVLDPDSRSRERLEEVLSPEFPFVTAMGADQAVARMAEGACGVVLLDLASMDGTTPMASVLYRHLRMAAHAGSLRLIGLGDGPDSLGSDPSESGVDDVLFRPIDRSEVLARVRLAVRKQGLNAALKGLETGLDSAVSEADLSRQTLPPARLAA
ncbi:response regulator [Microvirga sp. 2TAF3]|uniref:response regulator n=1 Tax=Microvirga sp. 2TAF3 TaxID=3233014 RepID=UPI003F972E9E